MISNVRNWSLLVTLVALCAIGSPAAAQDVPPAPDDVPEEKTVETEEGGEESAEEQADPDEPGLDPFEESGEAAETETRVAKDELARYYQVRESVKRQIQTGQNAIHIYQLVEEIVDEVVADVSELNPQVVSPAAVRSVGLTPNLSKQFGEFVEATLVTQIANKTDLTLKNCTACQSLRSRVEDGEWVVTLGLTRHEDLRREAKRLGVRAFMDAKFSYFPGANVVALNVRFTAADDGEILWTETYRSDATTAAILRSGDRVLTRKERVKELERLIEQRPYYGHILYVGASHIPYDSPQGGLSGAALGYRLYEKFGQDRRWMFGIGAEGFANFSANNPLLGSFVGATLNYQILPPNLNQPIYRVGTTASGFFAGQEGNSAAFQVDFDVTLQFRLGAGVSAMYFVPVTFAGADLGGFGYKMRASFNW